MKNLLSLNQWLRTTMRQRQDTFHQLAKSRWKKGWHHCIRLRAKVIRQGVVGCRFHEAIEEGLIIILQEANNVGTFFRLLTLKMTARKSLSEVLAALITSIKFGISPIF